MKTSNSSDNGWCQTKHLTVLNNAPCQSHFIYNQNYVFYFFFTRLWHCVWCDFEVLYWGLSWSNGLRQLGRQSQCWTVGQSQCLVYIPSTNTSTKPVEIKDQSSCSLLCLTLWMYWTMIVTAARWRRAMRMWAAHV